METQNVNIYSTFYGADKTFGTIQMPILMQMRITSSSGTTIHISLGEKLSEPYKYKFVLAVVCNF